VPGHFARWRWFASMMRSKSSSATCRWKLSWLEAAAELRLREKRAIQLQDLIGFAQRIDALLFGGARTIALFRIALVLANPVQQGLRRAANLRGDRFNGGPLRWTLAATLRRPYAQRARELPGKTDGFLLEGSNLSKEGASSNLNQPCASLSIYGASRVRAYAALDPQRHPRGIQARLVNGCGLFAIVLSRLLITVPICWPIELLAPYAFSRFFRFAKELCAFSTSFGLKPFVGSAT
jgi:hypothetical protein